MPQETHYLRSVAGLTLKNNIRSYYPAISQSVLDYVKQCCLEHIGEEVIGKTIGLVIAAIMDRGQVHNWPHGLQVLLEKLDDPSTIVVEVRKEGDMDLWLVASESGYLTHVYSSGIERFDFSPTGV
jgi:transportin-1